MRTYWIFTTFFVLLHWNSYSIHILIIQVMNKTSSVLLALLANGPVRMDGVTYFLQVDKSEVAKQSGDPKNTGPRKKKNHRTALPRYARCGGCTAVLSGDCRYGEFGREKQVLPRATRCSIPSTGVASDRARACGRFLPSASRWGHWMPRSSRAPSVTAGQ